MLCSNKETTKVKQKVLQNFMPFTPYPYVGTSVACVRCGLMRTNPMPTEAEITEYYSCMYRFDYGLTHSKPSKRHLNRSHKQADERVKKLGPVLKPGARVLDFGCGAGVFLLHAKAAGFDALGIEPGTHFADIARQELELKVINEIWEDVELPGKFDLITAVEVLEHLCNPVRALRWLRDGLSEDGIIYITVPNMLPDNKETFRRFHFAHLFQFTPSTLFWSGEAAGLEPNPRFEPNGTHIVFRRTQGNATLPKFDRNYGEGLKEQYPHTSIAAHLLSGRWLQSLGHRWKKTFLDTIR